MQKERPTLAGQEAEWAPEPVGTPRKSFALFEQENPTPQLSSHQQGRCIDPMAVISGKATGPFTFN
jgi:hypothetical protein